MTKMCVTMTAKQFDPAHTLTVVRTLHDIGLFEFRVKTGPATARIEFTFRTKQRVTAAHTIILPLVPVLVILATEWRFGSGLSGDAELLG